MNTQKLIIKIDCFKIYGIFLLIFQESVYLVLRINEEIDKENNNKNIDEEFNKLMKEIDEVSKGSK